MQCSDMEELLSDLRMQRPREADDHDARLTRLELLLKSASLEKK